LIIAAAIFAMSCGGAALPTPATADPLGGQYIVNGGGGALDNVKALTDAFGPSSLGRIVTLVSGLCIGRSIPLTADPRYTLGYSSLIQMQ